MDFSNLPETIQQHILEYVEEPFDSYFKLCKNIRLIFEGSYISSSGDYKQMYSLKYKDLELIRFKYMNEEQYIYMTYINYNCFNKYSINRELKGSIKDNNFFQRDFSVDQFVNDKTKLHLNISENSIVICNQYIKHFEINNNFVFFI